MWKKESTNKNALYINFCAVNRRRSNLDEIYRDVRFEINTNKKLKSLYAKCDETSRKNRRLANAYFKNGEWQEAIDWYNEALCFAEKQSTSMGIEFANRSACFFNMKLYDQCLIDIQLAKENNCPKHLLPELEQRKLSCQKYIANGIKRVVQNLQLDFAEYEQFPGMANAIEITKNADSEHVVVATQNIDVGQVVAIDEGFIKTLFVIYGWKCCICLKSNTNLVPCKKCTTAMFCHDCDNNIHRYECGIKTTKYSDFNNYLMQELRTFFVAMDLFTDAEEMMQFVEQAINSDELPNSLKGNRSKYRVFLKSANNTPESEDVQFAGIVFCVYKILLEIPQVGTMFASKRHRRFLMHLIGNHVQINLRQTYVAIKEWENNDIAQRKLYSQVGVMLSYFKHSHSPNIVPIDRDGNTIYIAIRPIQPGQQLFVSNYSFHWNQGFDFYHSLSERKCKCECCELQRPSEAEIMALLSDSDYELVETSGIRAEIEQMERERFDILKEKCVKLLKTYGQMRWCKQLGIVMSIFGWLLKAEINGTVQTNQAQE